MNNFLPVTSRGPETTDLIDHLMLYNPTRKLFSKEEHMSTTQHKIQLRCYESSEQLGGRKQTPGEGAGVKI